MRSSNLTEPLSPGRFRIQFTADASLKDKLELARDLLRHAIPSGDLAAIIHRALDLLVTDLNSRRFGARNERRPPRSRKSKQQENGGDSKRPTSPAASMKSDAASATTATTSISPAEAHAAFEATTSAPTSPVDAHAALETTANTLTSPSRPHASGADRATRRVVSERDGFCCTWQGPDGVRCGSRAWLEHDHRIPRALGGATNIQNVRLLCRAHNRRAAELVFGRQHIENAIVRNQTRHRTPQQVRRIGHLGAQGLEEPPQKPPAQT
jgi:5-methylcytosine-specific restriction endonuclease McrA